MNISLHRDPVAWEVVDGNEIVTLGRLKAKLTVVVPVPEWVLRVYFSVEVWEIR